ncbi:PAS domain S-box protein [Sandarakinorhabdus sp.]|uniref:PAS domain-containing sensor histidine kinase n=1 Tax=Sandarakinorhabdus sp. TaxID=1916663 RepID=UPI00286E9FD7|nr:PAS domain S-box protein [Sandarakinorhabdus sp.]
MCPFRSAEPGATAFQGNAAYQRSILATVPDAMIVIDDHGMILSFSAAAERMFGYAERDVAGRNVNMLMPQPDRQAHDGYMARYLETGVARIIGVGRVTTATRSDGSNFPIELAIGDAITDEGRMFTGFVRDLSERQQSERRLADLQAELAHISRVSAMGSLASALAHELNQPLTAIANYLEGARDLLGNSDAASLAMIREALDEAAAQSLRAGQIVRRLRDFIARGDSEKRVESLRQLVTEASALALTGSGPAAADLEVRLSADCDRVLVDRIQIQQVLLNLIRNAVEAMHRSPRRRIVIRSLSDGHGMVTVIVADSGPGLAPDAQDHLFEPFHTSKDQGMGLGLSICRTIVEAHGGRIWAEPADIGGAAFHFTLTIAADD